MKETGDKLNNSPIQLWNKIKNAGLVAVGDPRVTNFLNAANAVAGEMATVFKGTSGTDQEIKAWRDNLSASMSPTQIQGSVDTLIELLGSRMLALNSQFEAGMGKVKISHS